MIEQDDIPEDKLLEMPEQALPDGLSRLWAIRSGLQYQHQVDELNRELAGDAPPRMIFPWTDPREIQKIEEKRRREQREYEEALHDITERQDRLLLRIEEEQARIEERRREIDNNALRLHDGRRVYVDGERFRDNEGRVLTGTDEAEAARQREYRPDASTWGDKQNADHQAAQAEQLRQKVLKDKQEAERGGADLNAVNDRLSGYEKEFHDNVEARAQQAPADYGSANYMDEYAMSAVPAFTKAAQDKQPSAGRKDTENETSETKNTLRSSGPGAFKPG